MNFTKYIICHSKASVDYINNDPLFIKYKHSGTLSFVGKVYLYIFQCLKAMEAMSMKLSIRIMLIHFDLIEILVSANEHICICF